MIHTSVCKHGQVIRESYGGWRASARDKMDMTGMSGSKRGPYIRLIHCQGIIDLHE